MRLVHIVGVAGSLRQGSYNRALLREALTVLPAESSLEILEIGDLPLFNQDLENDPPAEVIRFKKGLAGADALLLVTPEYNYSIPGVLKNALDWASRPPQTSPLTGKPVALIGASTSGFGTVRSQLHLRQVCVYLDLKPINRPELMISRADQAFDATGHLVVAEHRERLREVLGSLVDWAEVLRLGRTALAKP